MNGLRSLGCITIQLAGNLANGVMVLSAVCELTQAAHSWVANFIKRSGRPLGRGRFGRVYLVGERSSGYVCALEVLCKNEMQQAKTGRQVRREIEIQSNLRHPNILPLLGHFHDSKRIFLILDFASKGDLSTHLRRENQFPEWKAAQYIAQIAQALKNMHRKHAIHHDIQTENILLGVHGEIKISDFGSSVHAPAPINRRHTFCGTLDDRG
jgi:aurora kinase